MGSLTGSLTGSLIGSRTGSRTGSRMGSRTGSRTGSRRMPGLIKGAGTSPSSGNPCGRVGSIGGLFLSGGRPSTGGTSGALYVALPFTAACPGFPRDLGRRLLESSLRSYLATES